MSFLKKVEALERSSRVKKRLEKDFLLSQCIVKSITFDSRRATSVKTRPLLLQFLLTEHKIRFTILYYVVCKEGST